MERRGFVLIVADHPVVFASLEPRSEKMLNVFIAALLNAIASCGFI
jgi:hypothetical protein